MPRTKQRPRPTGRVTPPTADPADFEARVDAFLERAAAAASGRCRAWFCSLAAGDGRGPACAGGVTERNRPGREPGSAVPAAGRDFKG